MYYFFKPKELLVFLLLFFSGTAAGTEIAPWFGNFYEFEARLSQSYQQFNRINTSQDSKSYQSHDHFTHLSLAFVPDPNWSAETELLFAATRHRNFGFDSGKITGRYLFMDDIVGDPVSLTGGLSLTMPLHTALRDIGSFHHGMAELEGHVSVGMECPFLSHWLLRYYGSCALGIATQGSPWLKLSYFWERNFLNGFAMQLYVKSLFGFGRRSLHIHDFNGYGAVAHRSVDTGFKLSYEWNYGGILSIEYAYRLYAKNFPRCVNSLRISYLYYFNL